MVFDPTNVGGDGALKDDPYGPKLDGNHMTLKSLSRVNLPSVPWVKATTEILMQLLWFR